MPVACRDYARTGPPVCGPLAPVAGVRKSRIERRRGGTDDAGDVGVRTGALLRSGVCGEEDRAHALPRGRGCRGGGGSRRPAGRVASVHRGRALRIRANHTWAWHGLHGSWRSGDAEYPIVLIHALDGHDWKVGTAPTYVHAAQITIWDGYTYYYGKRAKS
jgi:hypothetical protein